MTDTISTREVWLLAASHQLRPLFAEVGAEIPEALQVSVGFPKGGRTKVGQCWAADAGTPNNIFVHPKIDDAGTALGILVHELVHAADNCRSQHRGNFRRWATRLGLEGKMTSTVVGDALKEKLDAIIDLLGPYPHVKLDPLLAPKKQGTRMLKVDCLGQECTFSFRTSRANLDKIQGIIECPACASIMEEEVS